MSTAARPTVTDVPDRSAYEVTVDGEHAGWAVYRREDDRVVFLHTEVSAAFEGHGVGSALVAGALEDVRGKGLKVVPVCSSVAAHVERHPETADLLA